MDAARGHSLGGDGTWIAVAGDSAGGNLAAALPIKARDTGLAPPQAAVLLAPITDFLFDEHESFERLAPLGIVYDTAFMGLIRGAYLVHGKSRADSHASPARGDLSAYPSTLTVSGTHDPLIDDNRAFVARLHAAGRTAQHFVREGMPHGFYFFPRGFPEGMKRSRRSGAFLARVPRPV